MEPIALTLASGGKLVKERTVPPKISEKLKELVLKVKQSTAVPVKKEEIKHRSVRPQLSPLQKALKQTLSKNSPLSGSGSINKIDNKDLHQLSQKSKSYCNKRDKDK